MQLYVSVPTSLTHCWCFPFHSKRHPSLCLLKQLLTTHSLCTLGNHENSHSFLTHLFSFSVFVSFFSKIGHTTFNFLYKHQISEATVSLRLCTRMKPLSLSSLSLCLETWRHHSATHPHTHTSRTPTPTNTSINTHTQTHICTHAQVNTHTHAQVNTHTHKWIRAHTHILLFDHLQLTLGCVRWKNRNGVQVSSLHFLGGFGSAYFGFGKGLPGSWRRSFRLFFERAWPGRSQTDRGSPAEIFDQAERKAAQFVSSSLK